MKVLKRDIRKNKKHFAWGFDLNLGYETESSHTKCNI